MAERQTAAEARTQRAPLSAGRAAGYCWLEHPSGRARCTRPPHTDRRHVDYYNGRTSITDARGLEWTA